MTYHTLIRHQELVALLGNDHPECVQIDFTIALLR